MISFKSKDIIVILCNLFNNFFLTQHRISGYNDAFDLEYLYQLFSDWYFVCFFAAAFHLSEFGSLRPITSVNHCSFSLSKLSNPIDASLSGAYSTHYYRQYFTHLNVLLSSLDEKSSTCSNNVPSTITLLYYTFLSRLESLGKFSCTVDFFFILCYSP